MKKSTLAITGISALALFLSAGCGPSETASPEAATGESGEGASKSTKVVNLDAKGAAALLEKNPGVVVLDVRTPAEFAEGHIAGAKNIDFKGAGFQDQVAKLDRSTPYLLHCRSGNRSGQSLPTFKSLGFEQIYHLDTGFQDWSGQGLPVKR